MKNNHKVFYEILTITEYMKLLFFNRYAFFSGKSFPLRILERIFQIDVSRRARRIRFGDLKSATGIRRTAYESAKKDLNRMGSAYFDMTFLSLKKINSNLILEKFYFNLLYDKYEYYGLIRQYIAESYQGEQLIIHTNSLPIGLGEFVAADEKTKVVRASWLNKVAFIASMIASIVMVFPFYGFCFWLKSRIRKSKPLENAIICEVDSHSIYQMYRDLFDSYRNVYYVTSGRYAKGWTAEEIKKYGLIVTGLSKHGLQNIMNLPIEYLIFCMKNFNKISAFGLLYLDLIKTIIDGNLIAPDAENSIYFTYEHMFFDRTLRNEFLRIRNNKSVFVCNTMYIVSRYFHFEYRYNFDILCSSGPCLESIYAMQQSETNVFLPTGAYDSHKGKVKSNGFLLTPGVSNVDDFESRVKCLNAFKGDSIAITILSTGVIDETYSEEVGLMRLALRLAAEPNIKVFIRQKPTRVKDKYSSFFVDNIGTNESIMLTHMEYQLFDFVGVSDLFLVANSGAASDICPVGAQFFSVNFLDDDDIFLWQTLVDGVYLDKETAFETIMNWVNDSPSGQRLAHLRRMQELSKLIAYQFGDFETYKKNFITQLDPYLPHERLDLKVE